MRNVTLLLLSLSTCMLFAERGVLKADCKLVIKGTHTGRSTVTVIPRDVAPYQLMPTNGRFTIDLPLEETYLIQFEHEGCVSKQLYFDTRVPLERHTAHFEFPLQVTLEKHKENFSYSGPVGFIHYQAHIEDFGYDTDYSVRMDPTLQQRFDVLRTNGSEGINTTAVAAAAPASPRSEPGPATVPEWGVEAPTLAHVPRKVHVLGTSGSIPITEDPRPPAPSPNVPEAPAPPPVAVPEEVTREAAPAAEVDGTREEELIVERNRVTTIVRLHPPNGPNTEFRRVVHHYGAVFHFQDGASITETVYRTRTGR
ncbi:MAG TPA: hypothetical protein VGE21_05865 [Flavobacteriales bacterium]